MKLLSQTLLHTGKICLLFIGNAELSNKMASYMMDQKVFVTKTFYSSGVSFVAVCCVTIQVEV
jgi:hypothetical protein